MPGDRYEPHPAPGDHDPFGLRARARAAELAHARRAATLEIEVEVQARMHAAHAGNRLTPIRRIRLVNRGLLVREDLRVSVRLGADAEECFVRHLDRLEPDGTWIADQPQIPMDVERLRRLDHLETLDVRVEVALPDGALTHWQGSVELVGWDHWPGAAAGPELCAAFVDPAASGLADLVREADAPRDGDRPTHARIVETLWGELAERGLTLADLPDDFAEGGARLRSPERVLSGGVATSLDLAFLMSAALERLAVPTLLVFMADRVLLGVWHPAPDLDQPTLNDSRTIERRVDAKLLTLIDVARLTDRPSGAYEDAVRSGTESLSASDFRFAVDLATARRRGITAWGSKADAGSPSSALSPLLESSAPSLAPATSHANGIDARLESWKRRLLDLSLRNRFLAWRPTRRSLALAPVPLTDLERSVAGGAALRLVAHPSGNERDLLHEDGARDLAAGRLTSALDADDHEARLVDIRRAARHSLEESGANTLFLAIGFLSWREPDRPDRALRAPLLLRPLDIQRSSNRQTWTVTAADDEPRVNETLLEKLAVEFGLDVASLAELPHLDDAVDVQEWLVRWRRSIVDLEDWRIEEEAAIGLFSFTKFLMWRDLDRQRDVLAGNRVTRFLVERPDEVFEPAPLAMARTPPSESWVPLDADSSQLAAVEAAVSGQSFVLEGPPGTGKSQTITNLIARALADGQRVLFVAEKRAALEVVQRRLDAIGLGPFCLELHSNKISKRAVVEQLGRALAERDTRMPESFGERGDELDALTATLDAHVAALHSPVALGSTLYELLGRSIALREAARVSLPLDSPLTLDDRETGVLRDSVTALARAAALVEPGPDHPLNSVRTLELSPLDQRALEDLWPALDVALSELDTAHQSLSAELAGHAASLADEPVSRARLMALEALGVAFDAASTASAAVLRGRGVLDATETSDSLFESALDTLGRRDSILGRWTPELLQADVEGLQNAVEDVRRRGFITRFFAKRRLATRLAPLMRNPRAVDLERVAADFREARTVLARTEELSGHPLTQALGPTWFDTETGVAESREATERASALREACTGFVAILPGTVAPEPLEAALCERLSGDHTGLDRRFAGLREARDRFDQAFEPVARALAVDFDWLFGASGTEPLVERVRALTNEVRALGPRIRDWCLWQSTRSDASDLAIAPLVERLEDGSLEPGEISAAFERALVDACIESAVSADPALRRFHGLEHDQRMLRFRELEAEWHALVRQALEHRIDASVPRPGSATADGSELGLLMRELRKKRGHLPVRRLLERLPTLLPRLAPCVLMSPLSAAQFLSAGLERFDLVVFDEASQIPAWDGVGAMARGRNVVVVGDSKQLPPTSFFRAFGDGAEDLDPDEDLEELESLLDECVACGIPRRTLDWHYRSRHESLIAFSNAHYYENRLETFPAPARTRLARGLEWRLVEGAIYDRSNTRTNRAEAEAMVEFLVELAASGDELPSIGVVTFSQAQQTLVEDLLEDAARSAGSPLAAAQAAESEPLFVKNLENVQGDERDLILLGVGYGPDAAGRFPMHFGPLNRQGGERRLNVAVTRARRRLVAFSSFEPHAIDLGRTEAVGVRHLRSFLEFAAAPLGRIDLEGAAEGRESESAEAARVQRDALASRLAEGLRERGFEVRQRVGRSTIRVDLTLARTSGDVVDESIEERPVLGLLLDGANYARAEAARDRDRIRVSVLRGLGWDLESVWALDLWSDFEGSLDKLVALFDARAIEPTEPSKAEPATPIASVADAAPEPEEPATDAEEGLEVDTGSSTPPLYVEARTRSRARYQERFYDDVETDAIESVLIEIVAQEGPIEEERALRRAMGTWGFKRSSAKIFTRLRSVLAQIDENRRPRQSQGFLWAAGSDPSSYSLFRGVLRDGSAPRQAEELPLEEIANAARWVLDQNLSLDVADLVREVSKVFGFGRVGDHVEARLREGVELLAAQGRCRIEHERVTG